MIEIEATYWNPCYDGPQEMTHERLPFVFTYVDDAIAFLYNIGYDYSDIGECWYSHNTDDICMWIIECGEGGKYIRDADVNPTTREVLSKTRWIGRNFE